MLNGRKEQVEIRDKGFEECKGHAITKLRQRLALLEDSARSEGTRRGKYRLGGAIDELRLLERWATQCAAQLRDDGGRKR